MLPLCSLLLISLVSVTVAHEEDVYTRQYNADNFHENVAKKNNFIMFYAPWCGHCQRLAPIWEELAEMLNQEEGNVNIAKVDCTEHGDLCNENGVTGYPTLMFFKAGESEGVKFSGTRDLPSLTTFITDQVTLTLDDEKIIIPASMNSVTELSEETFSKHVAQGKHFVEFYAPWCGHCQKLAPIWEQLGRTSDGALISKIDCTQHRSICNEFEIKGYPTLMWIEDGSMVKKYQGPRNLEDLSNFVNEMSGSVVEASESEEKEPKQPSTGSSVLVLSAKEFPEVIKTGLTFAKFFAPWCGHCKRLAPTWDELGKKFTAHPEVNIVKIDCTLEDNKELCNNEEIEGFPSIFLYSNGQRISEYSGNRSLEDLYDFIQNHLSAHDEL